MFKIGQRVRVTDEAPYCYFRGEVGVVDGRMDVGPYPYIVRFDGNVRSGLFDGSELEAIDDVVVDPGDGIPGAGSDGDYGAGEVAADLASLTSEVSALTGEIAVLTVEVAALRKLIAQVKAVTIPFWAG